MIREWQEGWVNLADDPDEASPYAASVRRGCMASINWIEQHPGVNPRFATPNLRKLARAAGAPKGMPIDQIAFIGAWQQILKPLNDDAREWFAVIVQAVSEGNIELEPSFRMMMKAIACGQYVAAHGWDDFNVFMHKSATAGSA